MNPLSPARISVDNEIERIKRIAQPIASKSLTTTLQTLYQASIPYDFAIRHLWAANITGSSATITVHMVPSGGTASDANAVCKGLSISANTTIRLEFIAGGEWGSLLQPGMSLQALCSSDNAINMGGWGVDFFGGES